MLFSCLNVSATPPSPAILPWQPITEDDFRPANRDNAEIGRFLFQDPILSGNYNISCQDCHHPAFGTSDGLSLGLGEGGAGIGPDRQAIQPILKRVPRNALALWNLGHRDFTALLWDGRVSEDANDPAGFDTPAEDWLPKGLNSVLAAQALWPLSAQFEMAGNTGENEVIGATRQRMDYGWPILTTRVASQDFYWDQFRAIDPTLIRRDQLSITHIANALADFMNLTFRSVNAPIDRLARGEPIQISEAAQRGLDLFYGEAHCHQCHSGPLMTDQQYHHIGLPPFGPGRTRQWDPHARDLGRLAETSRSEDRYRFRTPSLRNVTLTAPYGHNGTYRTLTGIIQHHLNPHQALAKYDRSQVILPNLPHLATRDWYALDDRLEMARFVENIGIQPLSLTDQDIADLVAFLALLEDDSAIREARDAFLATQADSAVSHDPLGQSIE